MNILEQQTQTFKALGEGVRVRIISLLIQHESLCVCEIVQALNLGQSMISRHLAILKNAQLVTAQRQGAWMHYQIHPNFRTDYPDLLQQLHKNIAKSPQLQQDLEHLHKADQ